MYRIIFMIAAFVYSCGLKYCPVGSDFYFPNTKDFSPRISLAWAPEALHGKTAIRTGFAIVYNDGQFGALYSAATNIGQNFSLSQRNIPTLSLPITPFLEAAAFNLSYSAKDRHRRDTSVYQWTFSIQQEVARNTMITVTYLGSKGTHIYRRDLLLNGIDPLTGTRPFASLTNSTIGWVSSDGISNLNALQAGLRRNLSTGLLISANYQWSHGLSDGGNGSAESTAPQNMNCRSCEYASTDFDVRHNFTTSAIWILPVGRGHHVLGSASRLMDSLQLCSALQADQVRSHARG